MDSISINCQCNINPIVDYQWNIVFCCDFFNFQGQIVKAETIEGRKDLASVSIQFLESAVPMSYKLHINSYLTAIRKKQLDVVAAQTQEKPKEQPQKVTSEVPANPEKSETPSENTVPAQDSATN